MDLISLKSSKNNIPLSNYSSVLSTNATIHLIQHGNLRILIKLLDLYIAKLSSLLNILITNPYELLFVPKAETGPQSLSLKKLEAYKEIYLRKRISNLLLKTTIPKKINRL
jgi:hypothetical protein